MNRKNKASSKNIIPVETGIYNHLKGLDSRFRGNDRLGILRSSLNYRTPKRLNSTTRQRSMSTMVLHIYTYFQQIKMHYTISAIPA